MSPILPRFRSNLLWRRRHPSGEAIRLLSLIVVLCGCTAEPRPAREHAREVRAVLNIAPSKTLRESLRKGSREMRATREHSEAFTLRTHAVRSRPSYSVRELSDEVFDFLLENGVLVTNCDIAYRWKAPEPQAEGDVEVSGRFRIVSTREAFPASDASWVAEAAWQAVPQQGSFSVPVPATTIRGSTVAEIDLVVIQGLEAHLARDIEAAVHRLLDSDGVSRFQSRTMAYGTAECTPEACPHEDGVDSLQILGMAQRIRDDRYLPASLAKAPAEIREEVVADARKVCAVLLPKEWKSVLRERINGRPVFISKTTVVLEFATGGERVTVNRNAFTKENEAVLSRIEGIMVGFVAKLNAAMLAAAGIDAEQAETRAESFDEHPECGRCGFKGEFKQDDDGNGACPKCGAPEPVSLPKPLSALGRGRPAIPQDEHRRRTEPMCMRCRDYSAASPVRPGATGFAFAAKLASATFTSCQLPSQ